MEGPDRLVSVLCSQRPALENSQEMVCAVRKTRGSSANV